MVKQDSIPFAETGRQIVFALRAPAMAGALPALHFSSLAANTQVIVKSGQGSNFASFASPTTINLAQHGQNARVDLPITGVMTDVVTVIDVVRGPVTVAIISP